jgi:Protein of unknown function (DUF1579)
MNELRTGGLAAGMVALCLAAGADQPPSGQKKNDQTPDKKDPQQAVEPRSSPGAGQKFLEQFAGDWDVEKKFFPRGGGEPSLSKGSVKQDMIHGGRFLRSEFTFDSPAGKSTGTGLIGFEPEAGFFTSTWIDSRQTRMSFRKSKEKLDGERIVLFGTGLGGEETRKSKTVTTLEEKGTKIVHKQFSIADDGTERPVMQLTLTKKAAAGTATAK